MTSTMIDIRHRKQLSARDIADIIEPLKGQAEFTEALRLVVDGVYIDDERYDDLVRDSQNLAREIRTMEKVAKDLSMWAILVKSSGNEVLAKVLQNAAETLDPPD